MSVMVDRPQRDVRGARRFGSWRRLRRLSGPIVGVLVWWALTAGGHRGPTAFPQPWQVVRTGVSLTRSGELPRALLTSLQRVVLGLGFGVVAGVVLAVAAGASRWGEDLIDSTMQVLKAVPAYAVVPLLIIWQGIDNAPKVTLIALACALPIYVNTFSAIRNIDARLVEMARSLPLGRSGIIAHVVLPGALPGFLSGLRLALANAWLALVVAEQINADSGLGELLANGRSWYRLDIIVLVIVVYALIGLASYGVVRVAEARLLRWRRGVESL